MRAILLFTRKCGPVRTESHGPATLRSAFKGSGGHFNEAGAHLRGGGRVTSLSRGLLKGAGACSTPSGPLGARLHTGTRPPSIHPIHPSSNSRLQVCPSNMFALGFFFFFTSRDQNLLDKYRCVRTRSMQHLGPAGLHSSWISRPGEKRSDVGNLFLRHLYPGLTSQQMTGLAFKSLC